MDLEFISGGVRCAAWLYPSASPTRHRSSSWATAPEAPRTRTRPVCPRPCVPRDTQCSPSTTEDSASRRRSAATNFDAQSDRRLPRGVRAAARQPGVDPTRIILWGVSQSGGHVFEVGASRRRRRDHRRRPDGERPRRGPPRIAAAHPRVDTPLDDNGWRSSARQRMGKDPVTIPIVARPGEFGALSPPRLLRGRHGDGRPIVAQRDRCDDRDRARLVPAGQVREADHRADARADRRPRPGCSPQAAAKAAFAARAEVRHYPCDHFDIFAGVSGNNWFERCAPHEVDFLRRHVAL